ncbi:ADP-dependent NAD(P)H-hydrate dehydratase [Subtercola frigoramans]|uniref:ADP-dependent (S)-NAD(P)H-hydrate dehydratase n=1 Tax=Subtercola frigoramans TaxID=120298 RepID=A0ABS2L4C2_9MICO|nr:ADP/ATP-dependent (S)-NAD(P)H-hydrate dehydratase [Subtercola frigoramans]MBM7471859.1 hydroxyethylthiazole kinase-like uncharacterized protein yjeF [Subtercola frigoramans]
MTAPTEVVSWRDFTMADARGYLAAPTPSDDKYSRGVLGVITGSRAYPGAAVLGVEAASRTGLGMVRYLGPGRATRLVLQRRPEIVTAQGRVQAWLLGSGMDAAARSGRVTAELVAALGQGHPVVIDAGALDLVHAGTGSVVITPHASELQRVLGEWGVDVSVTAISEDPQGWAQRAAELLKVTVLLKGHVTHIAQGTRGYRVTAPTTELAAAGSGDVLGGILGALLATHAQAISNDPSVMARLAATAAVVHGLAGEKASGGGPIVALDIAESVPAVISGLRSSY